jgi:hypothetical protein
MKGLWPIPLSAYVCYSGCTPWWLNHCFAPHLQELRCGWFYVRCVFHILAWMCSLWRSLVLEVDVNLYGLTTSNCRVGWKVCDLYHFLHMFVTVDVHPDGWTTVLHHIYKSWGVVGFVVSWVFPILKWMCMLTCVGSGCKPMWFDHFNVQSGWRVCDQTAFCSKSVTVDVNAVG